MKLNEIFTEWKTGGGIFSLMVNPPWQDSITGLELDIEYFTNQSGTKQPSLLLLNFIESNKISQEDTLTIANLLLNRFGRNWSKLWNTLLLEYNPINNYDLIETENLVIDEIINNNGESSNTSEIDSNRYSFDSETPTPTEGQRQTNSNEFTDNGTRNNTHVRELTRSGNVGVTTSQQMITAERDLWVWDFFKTIFKDVDSVLTVPIFSLDYCKKTYESLNGNENNEKYILPVATNLVLGGVRANFKTEGDTVPVHIDSNGFLFVPTYTSDGGSDYTLPVATSSILGGIKAEAKTEGDTVPVHIDSNGFLFVPTYTSGGEVSENLINRIDVEEFVLHIGGSLEPTEFVASENDYNYFLDLMNNAKLNYISFYTDDVGISSALSITKIKMGDYGYNLIIDFTFDIVGLNGLSHFRILIHKEDSTFSGEKTIYSI